MVFDIRSGKLMFSALDDSGRGRQTMLTIGTIRSRDNVRGLGGAAGFTLIEMLVVIAIIIILLLLLIPGVELLLEMSREAKCRVNMGQLEVAAKLYEADNNQVMNGFYWVGGNPYSRNDVATTDQYSIWKYVKDYDVYWCPTFRRVDVSAATPIARSYSGNWVSDPISGPGANSPLLVTRLSMIFSPARLCEMTEENPWVPTRTQDGTIIGVYAVNDGRNVWSWDGTLGNIVDGIATYHRNWGCNISFYDGHAVRVKADSQNLWKRKWMDPRTRE